MFKRVAGTRDILPPEISYWQKIEETSRSIFSAYNYKEIRPPIIEEAALFNRSLGEFTEVVQKQMFLIKNKDETYCLRPEATASVVRAYIENNLDKISRFQKFYYIGPMFRLERPQKGRLRQFHHIGAEVIGSDLPQIDIEIISLADALLKEFGIAGYTININTIGCSNDKKELLRLLTASLKDKTGRLCEDCRRRFKSNVLRILDCKKEACKRIVSEIELGSRHLCADCKEHFQKVREGLKNLSISYVLSERLVRGLDYYTRTVFEITHQELGAQDAIGAGGRYDNLIADLGGPSVPAIGFAFGVERLLITLPKKEETSLDKKSLYLIPLGEKATQFTANLLGKVRSDLTVTADMNYQGQSLKGALRTASNLQVDYVGIIGDNELSKGVITLKDMASGTQKEIRPEDLKKEFSRA